MLKVFKNFFCLQGSEYTRSLVDKKKDGSVVSLLILHINIHRLKKKRKYILCVLLNVVQVVNGLKQRILKLEMQCREKENALRYDYPLPVLIDFKMSMKLIKVVGCFPQ